MPQYNSLKEGIKSLIPEKDIHDYSDDISTLEKKKEWLKNRINELKSYKTKEADEWAEEYIAELNGLESIKKTDSAKPNKGAIINTVGDTVAESIPNAPKKDNSMPVPRRN